MPESGGQESEVGEEEKQRRNELGRLRALFLSGPSEEGAESTQGLPHTRRGVPAVYSSPLVEGCPSCPPRRFLFLALKKAEQRDAWVRAWPGIGSARNSPPWLGFSGQGMWQEASPTHWPWELPLRVRFQ